MQEKNITYNELIDKIKNKEFTNILFLNGAGISTSSGIPDFRSPGGVYSTLQKYNLDYPEQIFEISYFTKNPLPFYEQEKLFYSVKPHYTSAHYFMAELHRRGQLLYAFTQNIDGLELEAGLPSEKVCQVHGNIRGARCQKCGFKHDIEKYKEFIQKQVIQKCQNCKRGFVRPNVVFFGEQLDKGFSSNLFKIAAADCVFIMGTSLKVAPFNMSVDKISKNVPVIIVNRDMVYNNSTKYIHLKDDIDDSIEKLMTDLGWDYPKIERTYPPGWNSKNSTQGNSDTKKVDDNSDDINNDYSYSSGYYNDPQPYQIENQNTSTSNNSNKNKEQESFYNKETQQLKEKLDHFCIMDSS